MGNAREDERKVGVDELLELGLVEEGDAEAGRVRESRAGFAGSVVALVIASVAAVAVLAWVLLFWLLPPILAWLDTKVF
jgi:hypothetical protein